jgi:uncharacterized lipoprotein YehR (DUF1307 family)
LSEIFIQFAIVANVLICTQVDKWANSIVSAIPYLSGKYLPMYQSFRSLAIALLTTLTFSACFDIEEVIHFKTADSGTVAYIVDVSQMMDMIKKFGNIVSNEDEVGKDSQKQMTNNFDEVKLALEGIPGVSNVEQIDDEANNKFGIRADFANIAALNRVLAEVYKEADDKSMPEFVLRKKKIYEYLQPIDLKASFTKTLDLDAGVGSADIDPTMFFENMSVTSRMIFAGKKVKKSTNPDAIISADRHTLSLTTFPFKSGNTTTLKNQVSVK